ncbi:MAG: hypothetical protein F6J95_025400 [Leptolyngbya sp. SIO1E4]|nr:hypothetical protein [Leptolyngbya sp. SIO1E4]
MSQLKVTDLDFYQCECLPEASISGGRMTRRITPRVSTAAATALDTSITANADVSGDLVNGFRINRIARGSAASAAASATSIGGQASAFAFADAG